MGESVADRSGDPLLIDGRSQQVPKRGRGARGIFAFKMLPLMEPAGALRKYLLL